MVFWPKLRRIVIDNVDKSRDIIEALFDFTSSADDRFTLDQAIEALDVALNEHFQMDLRPLVDEALRTDPWTFYDPIHDNYLPRQSFFNGKKFLISPTPLERKKGFLIPGHRFIPFVQRHLPPSGYTILNGEGTRIDYKRVDLTMQQLQVFYSLFDYSRTIEFMIMEDEANADVLLTPNVDPGEPIGIWVLDLKEELDALPTTGFFELTVLNWRDGKFSLCPKTFEEGAELEEQRTAWCGDLEKVLQGLIFDRLGPMTDLYEQLAWSMFHGSPRLSSEPLLHIGGFLSRLKDIVFTRVNGVPLFWRKDESPEEVIFEHLRPSMPHSGTMDSVDAILHDVGCSLREAELESYMRDELFSGKTELEPVLERALLHRGEIEFANEEQEQAFHEQVGKMWRHVKGGYNRFADQRGGRCRSECLAIMDDVVAWMGRLDQHDVGMDALPKKEFVAISSLVTMITHTVSALNQPPHEITPEEILALDRALNPLRTQADQLMGAIDGKLFPPKSKGPQKRPVFRVIQGGLSEEEK